MNRLLLLVVTVILSGLHATAAPPGRAVTLLEKGQSKHRIILDANASPSEKHAAEELRRHFKACTGVDLPVGGQAPNDGLPRIVLGCGPAAAALGVKPTPAELGEQGYCTRTVPPHLVIAGSREAGTLYGVHRFLEEHLGVRWYAPGVTKTPKITELTLPKIDRLARPAFAFRDTTYALVGADADFLVRLGENSGGGGPDNPRGNQYAFDGIAHSYFRYVAPSEFFEEHPEYFSEKSGTRIRTETQLCLTNPDVLRIVTERMLERMRRLPKLRQHNFSQMDHYNYCECPACRELNAKLGTTGGTQFWFLNQLAERTSKVYPKKLVGTLAYTFTEEPPKDMKMHPNVAVWLCHMYPCCDMHPIATCPLNAQYKRRAEAWARKCAHLYVWHYIVDFAHYYTPFPNFRTLAADMKFYRRIGLEGVFLQGMGHRGGGGEFSLLRPYYGVKLLWDPDRDAESLLRDFLTGYYGQAWKPIWDYLQMLHDKVKTEDIHMHLYSNPAQGNLPDEFLREANLLFDRAEGLVKESAPLLGRVRVARMPLVYASLFPRGGYEIDGDKLTWLGDRGSPPEAQAFIEQMGRHGFQTIREHYGDPAQLVPLSVMINGRPEVCTIRNDALSVDVVPMLGGRTLRVIHRKSGQCITAHNVKRGLFFPFNGGLEHRVGEAYWSFGWMEPATVTRRSERSITFKSQTSNGLILERMLSLTAGSSPLSVAATLTNPGDKPVEVRLRSHLELDLGKVRTARVHFTNQSGTFIEVAAPEILRRLREGKHFSGETLPWGSWTFRGKKGLSVTQRFDPEEMDFTWVYAYPESLEDLEVELWTRRRVLGPGESVTLKETLEVAESR